MKTQRRGSLVFSGLLTLLLPLTAACSAAAPSNTAVGAGAGGATNSADGKAATISELCGNKDIKIGQVDGFGASSWRKIVHAELMDELKACPNVSLDYTNANGDLQTYISAVNSYAAQGYNAILTFDDFGSQALSALRSAHQAGIVVVPYIGDPGGQVGTDYDGYVQYDFNDEGKQMADWLEKQAPGAKALFTGGLQGGSPATEALFNGFKAEAGKINSSYSLLNDTPQPTNWDPAYNQKATAGALTKYPAVSAIVSDYGVSDVGALRSFVSAGRSIPPLATSASDNELGCFWLDQHKANPNFHYLALDGTTTVVRIAARKATALVNGMPDTQPNEFKLIPFVDTANGKLPTCQPNLPPDADLSSSLSPDQLKQILG
jgi:ribose transport system substrate-binding protein